ncbi:YccS/YhfK family membrane protein, partial [Salmonella enterica subsp. enterica serovar Kentucky]|nr:YccS/YhfK family membrane protein [Salmonella enterica subsp. enterica serovar Kentucky]
FALGLTLSTSGFILLGGLGQRYATIAFGALLIAIYTMLGTSLFAAIQRSASLKRGVTLWINHARTMASGRLWNSAWQAFSP